MNWHLKRLKRSCQTLQIACHTALQPSVTLSHEYIYDQQRRPYPCLSFSATNGCGSYHAVVVCVASSEAEGSAWSTNHNEVRPSADDLDGCADGYAAHLGAVDRFAHHRRVLLVLELRAGLAVASEVQPVLLIAAEPSRDGVVEEFAGSDEQSENHGVCVAEGRDKSLVSESLCERVRESSRVHGDPSARSGA